MTEVDVVNLEETLAKTKREQVNLEKTQQHYKKTYNSVIFGLVSILIILVRLSLPSIKLESVISLLSDIVLLISDNLLLIAFAIFTLVLVFLVLGMWVFPWLEIRREDKDRAVNLLIYEGMDDPGAVAAKKVPITGITRLKYDGQIRLRTEEGKTMIAEYFRVKRESNPTSPQVIVEYRWQGEQKTHILMLSGKFCKNIEGLPSGNDLIALSY